MAIGKRQVIIATMVLALGVAVYLNWQFTGDKTLRATETVGTVKELGESQFVNNPSGIVSSDATSDITSGGEEGAAATTANSTGTQYFAEARLARQKARDEAVELLNALVKGAESSEKAKTEAVTQAAALAKSMEDEVAMESLIKAKGFADCMVFLQSDSCKVVVMSDELLPSETITIRDLVSTQSKISFEKITIENVK